MTHHMINQPLINIGTLGSVSDGKSTFIAKCTGTFTQRHANEQHRNITIRQGYANMKIWKEDDQYYTTDTKPQTFTTDCGINCTLVNHISFIDCPGHQELIKVMLTSIEQMDGAIVVVAVDQPLANKPQLIQHLAAAKLGRIKKIIVCMNKIDLVTKDVLIERKKELDIMLKQYDIVPFAIIPTCFNKNIGLKYVIRAIMELFNPKDFIGRTNTCALFRTSRSFDINIPGTDWTKVVGGVIGGSLAEGNLKVGDQIEIRPGMISGRDGKFVCQPIITTILSVKTDTTELSEIVPGGLIGIRTDADPFYFKSDKLIGQIIGNVGKMPNVYSEISLPIEIVTLFGSYQWTPNDKKSVSIQIGTQMTDAVISNISKDQNITFVFKIPVCISDNQHIVICCNIDKILRIVAEGTFTYNNKNISLV
jgi:translation initiation factor 2 subunit 3